MRKIDNGVRGYGITSTGELYWNSLNGVYRQNGEAMIQLLESPQPLQWLKYEKPHVYVNDSNGNSLVLIEGQMVNLKNNHILKGLNEKQLLVSSEKKIKIYDIPGKTSQTVVDYRTATFHVEEYVFISKKGFEIRAINLLASLPIWNYSIESLGEYNNIFGETRRYEIRRFIGVHKDQLIVQLNNATLLFLNIGNGSKVHVLHLNESHPFKKNSVYDDDYPPHLVDDKLIWLNRQRLLEIDLNTYDIEIKKDYFNVPKKEQFRFMHSTHFEGKIYFVADYGWQYVTPSRVGVMDGNTGEIIWEQQLEKTGGLPEAPKVTSDKLFIRTARGELYIFEKSDFST